MKNLTWTAVLKRKCDKKFSVSLKIKYKKTICKIGVPDINELGDEEQFCETLKTVFGKKKGKKIAEQIINEISEL